MEKVPTNWFKYGDDTVLLLNKDEIKLVFEKWPDLYPPNEDFEIFYEKLHNESIKYDAITKKGLLIVSVCERTKFIKDLKDKRNGC